MSNTNIWVKQYYHHISTSGCLVKCWELLWSAKDNEPCSPRAKVHLTSWRIYLLQNYSWEFLQVSFIPHMGREFCEVKENSGFSRLFQCAEFLCIRAMKTAGHQKSFFPAGLGTAWLSFVFQDTFFTWNQTFFFNKKARKNINPIHQKSYLFRPKKKKVQLGYLKVQNIELQVSSKAI